MPPEQGTPSRAAEAVRPVRHDGGMTTTQTPTSLRADAEALLSELAGPDARLREDQWTAIEALVVHRRRAF